MRKGFEINPTITNWIQWIMEEVFKLFDGKMRFRFGQKIISP